MATISLTIPNAVAQRVTDAVAGRYGYQDTITQSDGTTIPNPQTKADFTKSWIIGILKDTVKAQEADKAAKDADVLARTKVDNEINIT